MAARLHAFWFGRCLEEPGAIEAQVEAWFSPGDDFDERLREQFGSLPEAALSGACDDWQVGPVSTLALVLALDQLPRNLFRRDPRAFAFDARAREVASAGLDAGIDAALHPLEAVFLYLPYEHSEDAGDQERSVALFEALRSRAPSALSPLFERFAAYARSHRAVIERFGRFPHRNAVLGRSSTEPERSYLSSGGETFGTES